MAYGICLGVLQPAQDRKTIESHLEAPRWPVGFTDLAPEREAAPAVVDPVRGTSRRWPEKVVVFGERFGRVVQGGRDVVGLQVGALTDAPVDQMT